ncbi:MAG: type IV pili twitching motility protein PilT, partial [Gammaproteobacteria bacterium]|nr:type IV pili twitching motility protein PilT [Gammaproteobacteria bacterium]
MATITDLLEMTLERDASDLHYMAGDPARIRQYGELVPLSDNKLDAEKVRQSIESIITPKARHELEEKDGADFAYELGGKGRFRVN